MRLPFLLCTLPFILLLSTCDRAPKDDAGSETHAETDLLHPNEDNTDIYDVDDEDPYLITNGALLGFKPGEPLSAYRDALREGRIENGEGNFNVYFIDGAEGTELGYLTADPAAPDQIGDIFVYAPNVVTEQGIRVGVEYGELTERLGQVRFRGSETEGWVYGIKDGLAYRLDIHDTDYNLDNSRIPAGAKVDQIVIRR